MSLSRNACIPIDASPEMRKKFNQLCREEEKCKLLSWIQTDIAVCELEGWSKTEYIEELQELLNSFKTKRSLK